MQFCIGHLLPHRSTTQIKLIYFEKCPGHFIQRHFYFRAARLYSFFLSLTWWAFCLMACFSGTFLIKIIMDDVIHMTIAVQNFLDHSTTHTSHYHFPPKRVSCFLLAFFIVLITRIEDWEIKMRKMSSLRVLCRCKTGFDFIPRRRWVLEIIKLLWIMYSSVCGKWNNNKNYAATSEHGERA